MNKIVLLSLGLVLVVGAALYFDGLAFFGLKPVHVIVVVEK